MKKLKHCYYLMRENHDWRYAKWIKSLVIQLHKIKIRWTLGYLLLTEWPVTLRIELQKTLDLQLKKRKKKSRYATFERLWRCSFVLSRALVKSKKIDSPHEDSNVKPFDFSLRCLTTGPQRLHDVPGHFKDHNKTRRKKYFLITLPFPKFTVFLIWKAIRRS